MRRVVSVDISCRSTYKRRKDSPVGTGGVVVFTGVVVGGGVVAAEVEYSIH